MVSRHTARNVRIGIVIHYGVVLEPDHRATGPPGHRATAPPEHRGALKT